MRTTGGRASSMAKSYASAVIPAPASAVWEVVRDFNALPTMDAVCCGKPHRTECGVGQIGCVRNFRLKNGGQIRERLLSLSDYEMSFEYSILESPMGVENYLATFRLIPVTDTDHTFAEWTAEFDAAPDREDDACGLDRSQCFRCGPRSVEGAVLALTRVDIRRSTVIGAPVEAVWAVLRDFNGHHAWHPAVSTSAIEDGESSDQVGCVRNFQAERRFAHSRTTSFLSDPERSFAIAFSRRKRL